MKFYFEPNHTVIQNITQKQTGQMNRHVVCKFDEHGVCETTDPKVIYILQNKLEGCTSDSLQRSVQLDEVKDILDDKEIRQLAKAKGIKSWHVKNIDNIKKELEV